MSVAIRNSLLLIFFTGCLSSKLCEGAKFKFGDLTIRYGENSHDHSHSHSNSHSSEEHYGRNEQTMQLRTLRIERFRDCQSYQNLPITTRLNVTANEYNKFLLRGNIAVVEDIYYPLEMRIVISKCDVGTEDCEEFERFTLRRICTLIDKPNSFWSSLVRQTDPPLRCPIKSDVYRLNQAIVDFRIPARFLASNFKWVMVAKIYRLNESGSTERDGDHLNERVRSKLLSCTKGVASPRRRTSNIYS